MESNSFHTDESQGFEPSHLTGEAMSIVIEDTFTAGLFDKKERSENLSALSMYSTGKMARHGGSQGPAPEAYWGPRTRLPLTHVLETGGCH